jgi:hypothetical protein
VTRHTIIWFVGAAVLGAAAAVLHVLRTDLGGAHEGVPLAVAAWGATALAGLMIYRGVMVAAREQDEAESAGRLRWGDEQEGVTGEPVEVPEAYTFRAGKQVTPREQRRRGR